MITAIRTLKRWLLFPHQRKYEWGLYYFYWVYRRFISRTGFWCRKQVYWVKDRERVLIESVRVLNEVMRTILGTFLISVLLVAILLFLENLLHRQIWTEFFANNLLNASSYTSLLSTIAQIGAVFLGLYFTAVSVVASTVYSEIAEDVRLLLIHEKVGNIYIKSVTFLTSVALIFLVLDVGGLTPSVFGLLLIFILGICSILSFVHLGRRVLYFFNPTELVVILFHDISYSIRSCTPAGLYWKQYAFQVHYQKKSESLLKTYKHLVDHTVARPAPESKMLLELANGLAMILNEYSNSKYRIPSASYWFSRIPKHKNWLLTNFTEIEIALNTGTSIYPELLPDQFWLEKKIKDIVRCILIVLLKNGEIEQAIIILNNIQFILAELSEKFMVDEALLLARSITSAIYDKLESEQGIKESGIVDILKLRAGLGLVEAQSILLTTIVLGFSKALKGLTKEVFINNVGGLYLHGQDAILGTAMPRTVADEMVRLQNSAEFEKIAEGKPISNGWYTKQIIALAYARHIEKVIKLFIVELKGNYTERARKLIKDNQCVFTQELAYRGLESIEKMKICITEGKACFSRMEEFRKEKEIPWPNIDWDSHISEIQKIRKDIIQQIARSSVTVASTKLPESLPDYFGKSYSFLAEECYYAMATDDETYFNNTFPAFFIISLEAYQRLRDRLEDSEQQTQLIYSSEPIGDLLALSGIALIYSELNGKRYWQLVKKLWDEYFSKLPDATAVTKLFVAIFDYRESLFLIKPRDSARYSWKRDISEQFGARGLINDDQYFPGFTGDRKVVQHKSALIRALSRSIRLFEDPQSVFIVCYLLKRPEATTLEMPRHAEGFADSLNREIERDSSVKGLE
jgi:hypothetical protein